MATAYLHDFRPVSVGSSLAQGDILAWLKRSLVRTADGRRDAGHARALTLYDRLARGGAIARRASVVKDFRRDDRRGMELFRGRDGASWHRPTLQARMAVYEKEVLRLAARALPAEEHAPDFVVQISCTGYASPNAAQRIVSRRGWGSRVLNIGHMGCYASVPAAAMAGTLVGGEAAAGRKRARAALFFAELCSLHLKPSASADDQVVVNSLFADGAIRFDVSADPRPRSFELLASAEEIVPHTERDMTWRLQDSSFAMTLSREVPALIEAALADFVARFLAGRGTRLDEVRHFAIHPGGPRVIDSVLRSLGLPASAARHSRELLRRRGNMSSATLPHVWDAMLEDSDVRPGDLVLSLAFGPGLTLVANLLRKRR